MASIYNRFRKGLDEGLAELWQPWFMSGVRNGGFEQTLRNVCMPYIEGHTGRTAFTESGQRADLLLCGPADTPESRTRCEFKVNFAVQHKLIADRIKEATEQVERKPSGPKKRAADGIIVYAIAELVMLDGNELLQAHRHNEHVSRTPYKKFVPEEDSMGYVSEVKKNFPKPHWKKSDFADMRLCDGSGLARLRVWTRHIND